MVYKGGVDAGMDSTGTGIIVSEVPTGNSQLTHTEHTYKISSLLRHARGCYLWIVPGNTVVRAITIISVD